VISQRARDGVGGVAAASSEGYPKEVVDAWHEVMLAAVYGDKAGLGPPRRLLCSLGIGETKDRGVRGSDDTIGMRSSATSRL
jgi:hypothetical protein